MNNIKGLLTATQNQLYKFISETFMTVDLTTDYIIYKGKADLSEPLPMLCVHLDTINTVNDSEHLLKLEDIVTDGNILSLSPKSMAHCLGGDDRAGLWIALNLIKYMESTGDFKYRIGFFTDEEIGGIGSGSFKGISDLYNTTCYIGLDRRSPNGSHEVAYYDYKNEELLGIFEDLGYSRGVGSFTDASNLSNSNIACCNLSVGYDNEHTTKEVLYLDAMNHTLEVLKELKLPSKVFVPEEVDLYSYDEYYSDGLDLIREIDRLEYENDLLRDALINAGLSPEVVLNQGGYNEI